jgi:hypothetical protein
MADHKTNSRDNHDGSTHYSRHSYENEGGKYNVRQSFDVVDGEKVNVHSTDQNTGETYYHQDTTDGNHKAGDVTDSKGNFIRNNGGYEGSNDSSK